MSSVNASRRTRSKRSRGTKYRRGRRRTRVWIARHPWSVDVAFFAVVILISLMLFFSCRARRQHVVETWIRGVEPPLAMAIITLQAEIEALPACFVDEAVRGCTMAAEITPELLWQARARAVDKMLRDVRRARAEISSLGRVDDGWIRVLIEWDMELIFVRFSWSIGEAVTQRDDAAFRSEIDWLKAHVSRLSGNAREYGFDVPAVDWQPAPPIFVDDWKSVV